MDSNKVDLLQVSVALLIVQCSFADSNVKRRAGVRFYNTSHVMQSGAADEPPQASQACRGVLGSSDNYNLRHVTIELAA